MREQERTYGKGLVTGIILGIAVPLLILFTAVFFNIGNIGNLVQTVKILNHYSLESLSFSEKTQGAIAGMVQALDDPYSYYLTADDYSDLLEEVNGTYDGIGIYLTTEDGAAYTTVMAPIKNSPAFEAGIKAGDQIVSINGETMRGVNADTIATLIKTGDEAHFTIEMLRDGETLTFEVERAAIDIPSVDGRFLEGEDGIAYISISTFAENTPAELSNTISSLAEKGTINGIILDLRNNPGGSVSAVVQIADMFLADNEHILWVESKDGEDVYDAQNTNPYAYPLVMLTNENSASASEILAGAFQDNQRATLVGNTTYGKGIIQTVYSLGDGAAIKVTTAEYLSPDKNKIHEIGVTPDVEIDLGSSDISLIYSLDPTKDVQLKTAIDTMNKKLAQ
ncbi:MAG TPA: S41 family peptidase [Clostridiales bacterium]|nr:S41 family peptidase [Clostridiales bacterium]